jgi:hypothetical protein
MQNEKDEIIRQWCKGLLKEMLAEKRAQHRRAESDKRPLQ